MTKIPLSPLLKIGNKGTNKIRIKNEIIFFLLTMFAA